jgi:hypothetical protein
MNFNKTGGSIANGGQSSLPPPLPSVPPPSNLLHQLPPAPALPPPLHLPINQQNQHNSSMSSYSSSSASSTSSSSSSSSSNYLQPKINKCSSPMLLINNNELDVSNKSCSFSTNNLNRLKFSNISNQAQSINNNFQFAKQPQQATQPAQLVYYQHHHQNYQPISNSVSMRNINEISYKANNNTSGYKTNSNSNTNLNYNNLQQALKAATAALQKTRIPSNEDYTKNSKFSFIIFLLSNQLF